MPLISRRNLSVLALLAALGLVVFWLLSAPHPLDASVLPQHTADLGNGERLYYAGGCYSCHKPSPDLKDVDAALPAGGYPLKTPIGTLFPPNLTPDPETGLGRWTDIQFVNAVQRGISPGGRHYIPAFPYTSYAAMRVEDVLDIKAYLASFPPVKSPERDDGLPLAFLRRGIGLWKLVGLDTAPWRPDPTQSHSWNRGSYLVNGPGHCAECHTPRNLFMVRDNARAFAGGPHPDGSGDKVPSQRDLIGRGRYKDVKDLATALQFGEIFGYKKISAGGMGQVQANISKLPEPDIAAIAEYLASLK